MDCEKIFNTKTHVIYHSNPLLGVCHICYFHLMSLIYTEVWSVEAFRRTSEREGEKTAWKSQ